ncbi:LysR substrate-binding domain-containing protein [Paremcibacter congregatus]|tara:strand:+ start:617 stop:1510 length:894 start_codon:yes stop_codon:yes gene_type:complete
MLNWDDIRIFLAVAQEGSVRAAAAKLHVNHSTVSRRITAFEEQLNVRLFERLQNGYLLTTAGEELLESAHGMADKADSIDRHILGRDNSMTGSLCVTLPSVLGTGLLIGSFAEFCELYPGIDLKIILSYDLADLNKREADVAIRVTNNPPESLVGRRILTLGKAPYVSKELWRRICDEDDPTAPSWLGWKFTGADDDYIQQSLFPKAPIRHTMDDPDAMLAAVKAGMGIAALGCMAGDRDPELMRLPESKVVPIYDLWVLTHRDLRQTLRVKTFMDFIVKALLKHRDLLEGRSPRAS